MLSSSLILAVNVDLDKLNFSVKILAVLASTSCVNQTSSTIKIKFAAAWLFTKPRLTRH